MATTDTGAARISAYRQPGQRRRQGHTGGDRVLLRPPQRAGVAVVKHVGSTAVPGLATKPVVDLMASVDSQAAARAADGPLAGGGANRQRTAGPLAPLTKRQLNIAHLAAQGKTRGEIADELGITTGTVHLHLNGARKKLGLSHTRGAEALYRRLVETGRIALDPFSDEGTDT